MQSSLILLDSDEEWNELIEFGNAKKSPLKEDTVVHDFVSAEWGRTDNVQLIS